MSTDTEAVRERLERERADVQRELDSLRQGLERSLEDETEEQGSAENHLGDLATETFNREMEVTLEDNARDLLGQYDAALARLADGTYGRCVDCGRPIEAERLEALPYVATCIEDARKREAAR